MRITLFLFSLLFSVTAAADTRQIWDSPAASVSQTFGITDVTLTYHRPQVKGREIWGKLVPFNEVWRAGANEATTIAFTSAVKLGGKEIPAGSYALFVQPAKDKWTIIVNKDAKQWGAFTYKADQDVARFDVIPAAAPMTEWLTFSIDPTSQSQATISMKWEKLEAKIPLEVDVDAVYQAYLKTELQAADAATDPKAKFGTYLAAARYWVTKGEHLDDAKSLLEKAEKLQASFWIDEYRARMLQKQGKKADALASLEKAKKSATGKMPPAYLNGLDALKKEWSK